MERPSNGPSVARIWIHEIRVLVELLLINLLVSIFCHFVAIRYDLVLPVLIFFLLRTKRYDVNIFDEPVQLWLHMFRVVFVTSLLYAFGTFTGKHDYEHIRVKNPERQFPGYGILLMEMAFCSMLFCFIVLVMRFWCNLAIYCGAAFDSVRPQVMLVQVNQPVGPSGDAPALPVYVPVSQSFPELRRRNPQEEFAY